MSDNDDDAEFEASLANLEVSGFDDAGGLLPGTSDPEIASRLDSLHSTVSTLGMRLDSLVTSTTTYRSSLTDRLTEYADLVTKLTRTQSADLEEYRRANERTVSELRRSLGASEEVLERVGARIDSLLTEAETSDDSARRMLGEVRSILDAQESLGRFITESLDRFAERVDERLGHTQQASVNQLEALRTTLDDLAGRDLTRGVRDDLAELRSIVVDLRSQDPSDQVQGLQSRLDSLLEIADADRAKVSTAVDELRETLLDVASGEVVGALWDEVRGMRATLEEVTVTGDEDDAVMAAVQAVRADVAAIRTTLDEALIEPDDLDEPMEAAPPAPQLDMAALDDLHDDVASLAAAVRELLEQAEVVDESAPSSDAGLMTAVAADVSHLRQELASGLVVEPSDALAGAVDELRTDLAELRDRLGTLADLEAAVDGLRTVVEEGRATPAEASGDDWVHAPVADDLDDGATADRTDELAAEIRELRAGVSDIIARLDEGLVLADDELAPPAGAVGAGAATSDELAALRDQVATEFDALREIVGRSGGAEAAAAPAGLDPDTVDLLREEIRGAAGSDEVLEALTKELKALRRRIRLRAEGEVFSPADLDAIAAAVADRLAD